MPSSPFLGLPGAVEQPEAIDHGVPSHYGSPNIEQRKIEQGTAVVDLSNRGVITVTGPDRLTWLNSITSQELRSLAPGESTETLFLDINGRIEHEAKLVDDGTTVWLITEAEDAEPIRAWLDRMRFMLRVEVADVTEQFAVLGGIAALELAAASPNGSPLVWHDPWRDVTVGGHQYARAEHPAATWTWTETIVPRADLPALVARIRAGELTAAGSLAAEALRIAAWRPRLAAEVDERSIPHELDWLRSAVHLNKGCYRGQETVAKVHNLGHPPRRLVLLLLDGSDSVLPAPGSAVFLRPPLTREDGAGGAAAGGAAGASALEGALEEAPDAVAPAASAVDAPGTDAPAPDRKLLGHITSSAIHHELGPVALAVIKRTADPDAVLYVDGGGSVVTATQDVIVPGDAGAVADVPRLPRLGAVRR
ncbi:YgfZ/GcvT domain-containing protein [Plantibacter sp. YIM 135249]|uniref:CAF17-like 4Fe-4S cluster assembly/insertion protein YgfZ n=1 Tax=Plantibacter sp. YIM 135249 TaxID=3423918 RepID=UPI003D32F768